MAITECRFFSGYKPCGLSESCTPGCRHKDIPASRVLIIHLGAFGAVLRSTALLKAIRRRFPKSHITWITNKSAKPLLENNPLIDRIVDYSFSGITTLKALHFDSVFCIDKDLSATGLLRDLDFDIVLGFKNDPGGAIVPATSDARELWSIGINNKKKFFENTKPETQLITEALGLNYERDPYLVSLTSDEVDEIQARKKKWLLDKKNLIGINIGCAPTIPYKKLSINGHRELIRKIEKSFPRSRVVLLGGSTDTDAAKEISKNSSVVISDMTNGMRDGLLSVGACDVVVTGDSLGMHMAIALKKWVVAWFGPTCAHEIDLFERGVKVKAKVSCGPCWKRKCDKATMCYDEVDHREVLSAIKKGFLDNDSDASLPPAL